VPTPSIDFDNHIIQELPLYHRTPKFIAWFKGIIGGGSSWLYNLFTKYTKGDSLTFFWINSSTYNINDKVKTYDGVFISLKNSNINNNPNLNNGYWYKVSSSYLGADERSNYSAQKMSMEKMLNRYFMTEFRQPASIDSSGYFPLSDIYIKTIQPLYTSFVTFSGFNGSSASYSNNSGNNASFTGYVSSIDTTYQFIVYVPISLSISLGDSYDSIIREKIDSIYVFGTSYKIQTY